MTPASINLPDQKVVPFGINRHMGVVAASADRSNFGSGGDGTGGDHLEARVNRIEDRLDKLVEKVSGVEVGIATLNEKVAHLPSKDYLTARLQIYMGIVVAAIVIATAITKYL